MIVPPASPKTPAAAPITTTAIHADETMWRAIRSGSSPPRVSGTEVTRPSDEPVTATTADAIR